MIRKLQQLSISYHVETQSGRLQSKIMRDVEAVEGLSTQLFLSILNIALNIGVALVVTISKSRIVFIFFLLTTPVAAITMVTFRNIMKKRNTEFRKEMEETSARVMEMVELVPVTRAHALEDEEVAKMSGQLFCCGGKRLQTGSDPGIVWLGWLGSIPDLPGDLSGIYRISGHWRQNSGRRYHIVPELFCHGSQSGVLHRHPAAYHCQGY
ncbi:MAG: ABC transporter transmembrane domain-containing protein [Waltera sp.]